MFDLIIDQILSIIELGNIMGIKTMRFGVGILFFIFVTSLYGLFWWHQHNGKPHYHFFHKPAEPERPQHHHFYKYHRVIEPNQHQ